MQEALPGLSLPTLGSAKAPAGRVCKIHRHAIGLRCFVEFDYPVQGAVDACEQDTVP